MNKRFFEESKIEVINIVAEDVITTSDEGGTGLPPIPFSLGNRDTFDK